MVKLADLLGKKKVKKNKEKELLMYFQKTRNCRERKRMAERAQKKGKLVGGGTWKRERTN